MFVTSTVNARANSLYRPLPCIPDNIQSSDNFYCAKKYVMKNWGSNKQGGNLNNNHYCSNNDVCPAIHTKFILGEIQYYLYL